MGMGIGSDIFTFVREEEGVGGFFLQFLSSRFECSFFLYMLGVLVGFGWPFFVVYRFFVFVRRDCHG